MKEFVIKLLKDHLIIWFITVLFVFLFGGFLGLEKPVRGYIFSAFTVFAYLFLVYSDIAVYARRDFYGANGDKSNLDLAIGFKSAALAQIPAYVLIVALFVTSLFSESTAAYINFIYRTWMMMYMSFFPSGTRPYWLYFLVTLPQIAAAGISYIYTVRQGKTRTDKK